MHRLVKFRGASPPRKVWTDELREELQIFGHGLMREVMLDVLLKTSAKPGHPELMRAVPSGRSDASLASRLTGGRGSLPMVGAISSMKNNGSDDSSGTAKVSNPISGQTSPSAYTPMADMDLLSMPSLAVSTRRAIECTLDNEFGMSDMPSQLVKRRFHRYTSTHSPRLPKKSAGRARRGELGANGLMAFNSEAGERELARSRCSTGNSVVSVRSRARTSSRVFGVINSALHGEVEDEIPEGHPLPHETVSAANYHVITHHPDHIGQHHSGLMSSRLVPFGLARGGLERGLVLDRGDASSSEEDPLLLDPEHGWDCLGLRELCHSCFTCFRTKEEGWHSQPTVHWSGKRRASTRRRLSEEDSLRWRVSAVVHGDSFAALVGLVVGWNCLLLGLEADRRAAGIHTWQLGDNFEFLFCVFFVSELSARIYADRWSFFKEGCVWNVFDTFLVFLQVIDQAAKMGSMGGASAMRALRLVRLVRIARAFRAVHLFDEMRMIVTSMSGSLGALFWAMLLLLLIVYVFSVLFLRVIADSGRLEQPEHESLRYWFGSLPRTILTMFECILGGVSWDEVVHPLMVNVSPFMGIIFCAYITMSIVALMNLVTGLFVEQVTKMVREDKDKHLADCIGEAFKAYDEIDLSIFRFEMEKETMKDYFRAIDVTPKESEHLFELLAGDNEVVAAEEIVDGCLQLRGPAKGLDLALMNRGMSADVRVIMDITHANSVILRDLVAVLMRERAKLRDSRDTRESAVRDSDRLSRTDNSFMSAQTESGCGWHDLHKQATSNLSLPHSPEPAVRAGAPTTPKIGQMPSRVDEGDWEGSPSASSRGKHRSSFGSMDTVDEQGPATEEIGKDAL